jgi:NitT/TauT family transport system ATP-binding protein
MSTSATPAPPDAAGAPEQAGVRFERVSMRYPDGTDALAEISLSVAPGELVAVVGPSGCGKSTLLRVAAGLAQPTAGHVEVDRRSLGYVFQDPTLLPWRDVAANVGLLAELHGIPAARRRRLVADAIELVGLQGSERRYPTQLSGGMRMRASLARSLTLEPRTFLFDEPFGALDELTRERLQDELLALFLRRRFAGVFVTHSIAEAVFLATRVVVLSPRPGRVVADVAVGFPFPRAPELRFEAPFAALARQVSHALRSASP